MLSTRAPASVAASNFGTNVYFFFSVSVQQITFSFTKCNNFTFRCISVIIFISKVCKKVRVLETVHDIVGYQVSDLISYKIMTVVNKASDWLIHNLGDGKIEIFWPHRTDGNATRDY